MIYLNTHAEADALHKEAQIASAIARYDEAEELFGRALEITDRSYPADSEILNLQAVRILRDRALLFGRRAISEAANPKEAIGPLEEACTLAEEARDQMSYIHDFIGTSEIRDELAHTISTLGGLVLAKEVCISPESPAAYKAATHHEEAAQVFETCTTQNSYFRTLNLTRMSRVLLIDRRPIESSRKRFMAIQTALQAKVHDKGNLYQAISVIDTRFEDLASREAALASVLRKTPHTATEEVVNI